MLQIFIGLALLLFFAGYHIYLLLLVKLRGSADNCCWWGEFMKRMLKTIKLSLLVRELTSSSNRFIAICLYNYNPNS